MTDSTIQPDESLSFKEQYENAIDKSDHVPQSKIIGEFVLDALINSSGESQKIRELREQIKTAIGNADDDAAHELMIELKTIKDAEQESAAALAEISSKFSISQILSSFRQDPAFQEIVYGLAFKVLNHSHQALTTPVKTKTSRSKAEKTSSDKPRLASAYVVTKGEESIVMPIRAGRASANLTQDAEAFAFLGFSIADKDGREVLVPPTFTDKMGAEHPASRPSIIRAIEEKTAFEGFIVVPQQPAE
ncbi:hypothetical protein [Pseudomonas amygdali]|uniref:hypothetical protein n=1 Tax=Pseudomonas amygdali TaxID=47877 RepID=UPI000EFE9901|nr:hypothetical protein [Pseudomonas amygdali]RMV80695.1 hypothetical protein ALP04_04135 [Pseudomonas amygdali pv. sesami]